MLIILILWYITSLVLIISQLNVFTFWIAFSNNFNKVNMGQSVLLLQSDVWHWHWTPILALQRYICIKWSGRGSRSVMSDSLWPHGLYSLWNSPGQNTGVGSAPFSRGSSQARNQTQTSCITGIFFTIWATKEAPRVNLNILPIFFSMLILKKWGTLFQYIVFLDCHFDAFCVKNLSHLAPFSSCLNATYKWLMDICDAIKRSVITMPPSVMEYLEF